MNIGVEKNGRFFFSVGIGVSAFVVMLLNAYLWFFVYLYVNDVGGLGFGWSGIILSLASVVVILLSYIIGELFILAGSRIIKIFKNELDLISLRLEVSKIEKPEVRKLLNEYLQNSELFAGVGSIGLLSTVSVLLSFVVVESLSKVSGFSIIGISSPGFPLALIGLVCTCAFIPSVFFAKTVLKQHPK